MTYVKPGLPLLFAVWGTCGSYSDRNDWVIALYEDEAMAHEHVRLATEHLVALKAKYGDEGRMDFSQGFPYDVPDEERLRFDVNELGIQDDTEYYVSLMFVHQRPTAFQDEHAILSDKAREYGIWGNPYFLTAAGNPTCYLNPTTRAALARKAAAEHPLDVASRCYLCGGNRETCGHFGGHGAL